MLQEFREQTWKAISNKISTNPILHAFQSTVNEFQISHDLIEAFFQSMEMDLKKQKYQKENYEEYIYGSAEVVGLMCLHVFCGEHKDQYEQLVTPARHLGAAFQKINFLRDLKSDAEVLDRMYFPNVNFNTFTQQDKEEILDDIKFDFDQAYIGVKKLPLTSRFGVLVAYKYYYNLYKKLSKLSPVKIKESRVRIPNYYKAYILFKAHVRHQLNLI
jgi:phytoene/squalene synthetase